MAVATLSGEQVQTVITAVCSFDDFAQLAQFCRTKLDLKLTILMAEDGLSTAATTLIEWAEQNGAVERMLSMLQRWHGGTALAALIAALGIRIEDFPDPAPGALTGMAAVAADPATRAGLARYRPEIVRLCTLSVRLGALKFLHDKVDGLRNQVYIPLEAIRARMPAADAEDLIDQYQRNLAKYRQDIESKVAEGSIDGDDLPWIEERLAPAQATLLAASLAWPAESQINAVVTWLNGVTGPNLAELNGMIKASAAAIGDLGLHDKLSAIKTGTGALDDDIDRIDAGISILLDRVAAHSRWQNIKDQLGDLVAARSRPIAESRFSWDILEKRLGKVENPPDALAAARAATIAAFAAADPRALKNAINGLRTIIDERFYSIDKELLADATYVGQLGDGLKTVLEALDA